MSRGHRQDRIGEEIRKIISDLLLKGLKDPRLDAMISITAVDVTSDYSYATVYFSVLGADSGTERMREIEEGFANEIEVEEVIHGELAEMIGRIDSEVIAIPGTSGGFAVSETVHLELMDLLGGIMERAEGEIE